MPYKKAVNAFGASGVAHSWYPSHQNNGRMVSLCGLYWEEAKLDYDPKQVLTECKICKRSVIREKK